MTDKELQRKILVMADEKQVGELSSEEVVEELGVDSGRVRHAMAELSINDLVEMGGVQKNPSVKYHHPRAGRIVKGERRVDPFDFVQTLSRRMGVDYSTAATWIIPALAGFLAGLLWDVFRWIVVFWK